MAMAIGGSAVFVLLLISVIGYSIAFRPAKVHTVPTESELRCREWRRTRKQLSFSHRRTLWRTNRLGVAAPRELAEPAALRAEARLITLDSSERQRVDRSRRARVGFLLFMTVYIVATGLVLRAWLMVLYCVYPLLIIAMTVSEPARWTRSRRRLTQALFANHALIGEAPVAPASVNA